jgi:hypothetical protein
LGKVFPVKKFAYPLLLVAFGLVTSSLTAQEARHEVGLQFQSFDNFAFLYKKKRSENKFLRFSAGSFDTRYLNQALSGGQNISFTSSVGFAIGWENRQNLTGDFQFYHGFQPALHIDYVSERQTGTLLPTQTEQVSFRPALGYVLGFQYQAGPHFLINLESVPVLWGSASFHSNGSSFYRWGASFSGSGIALGVLYRF